MSSYRPPPLDDYSSAQGVGPPFERGRRRQRGHGHAQRGPPPPHPAGIVDSAGVAGPPLIVNPFGSPVSLMIGSGENNPDAVDAGSLAHEDGDRSVIVYVGGISKAVDDDSIKSILQACGSIKNWRRAQDASGEPLSFGFCEFADIQGAACAMRVLSTGEGGEGVVDGEWLYSRPKSVGEPKRLVLKTDSSTLSALDRAAELSEDQQSSQKKDDSEVAETIRRLAREIQDVLKTKEDSNGTADDQATQLQVGTDAGSVNNDNTPADPKSARRHSTDAEDKPFSLEDEEEWERLQAKRYRNEHYILAAKDHDHKLEREQAERESRIERNALRELDRVEERQQSREAMADMLSKWDDSYEESTRGHEYYRDRERWWHARKIVRTKELDLDTESHRKEEQENRARVSHAASAATERAPEGMSNDMPDATSQAQALNDTSLANIPKDQSDLFAWPIKWGCVDSNILKNKIEPVVRKKLIEYLGVDTEDGAVDDLAEFVIEHISGHKSADDLCSELRMVLVEEAPVFVANIWRTLVVESETRAQSGL
ncbi:hypothetical protein LPJ53_005809 [Coemansia erecta]|uniref:PWI domain-containing protein n=1 Tax=Coemansia erecta TaxID=147472 RepID=A0A9W7XVH2_9FUNG|nr:hypothetical protein LPJ53_005809 [Coemansia erecta]